MKIFNAYYIYAPVCKRYGTGHYKRALDHIAKYPFFKAIAKNNISSIKIKQGDVVYIDVKKCSFLLAYKLYRKTHHLIFIDDFGLGARLFNREIRVYIPHWKERLGIRCYTKSSFKPIKVYLYGGGLDPKKAILRQLKQFKDLSNIYRIYIQIGNSFSKSYIKKLRCYCDKNNLHAVFIDHIDLNLVRLSNYDLIYMTWGLHYLKYYDTYKIIPLAFDRHTKKLIKYFCSNYL